MKLSELSYRSSSELPSLNKSEAKGSDSQVSHTRALCSNIKHQYFSHVYTYNKIYGNTVTISACQWQKVLSIDTHLYGLPAVGTPCSTAAYCCALPQYIFHLDTKNGKIWVYVEK